MNNAQNLVSDDTLICSLSTLWYVNNVGCSATEGWSEQFVKMLVHAEIPLHYMNEDFDSESAYIEHRLLDKVTSDVRMQVSMAEFTELDIPTKTQDLGYFTSSLSEELSRLNISVPLWFDLRATAELEHGMGVEPIEPVPIGSFLVKAKDVKMACQTQGVCGFNWPTQYPFHVNSLIARYEIEKGVWQRALLEHNNESQRRNSGVSMLFARRLECVLTAVQRYNSEANLDAGNSTSKKVPTVQDIYRLVKHDVSFFKHGRADHGPVSFTTFRQLWKENFRTKVVLLMEK